MKFIALFFLFSFFTDLTACASKDLRNADLEDAKKLLSCYERMVYMHTAIMTPNPSKPDYLEHAELIVQNAQQKNKNFFPDVKLKDREKITSTMEDCVKTQPLYKDARSCLDESNHTKVLEEINSIPLIERIKAADPDLQTLLDRLPTPQKTKYEDRLCKEFSSLTTHQIAPPHKDSSFVLDDYYLQALEIWSILEKHSDALLPDALPPTDIYMFKNIQLFYHIKDLRDVIAPPEVDLTKRVITHPIPSLMSIVFLNFLSDLEKIDVWNATTDNIRDALTRVDNFIKILKNKNPFQLLHKLRETLTKRDEIDTFNMIILYIKLNPKELHLIKEAVFSEHHTLIRNSSNIVLEPLVSLQKTLQSMKKPEPSSTSYDIPSIARIAFHFSNAILRGEMEKTVREIKSNILNTIRKHPTTTPLPANIKPPSLESFFKTQEDNSRSEIKKLNLKASEKRKVRRQKLAEEYAKQLELEDSIEDPAVIEPATEIQGLARAYEKAIEEILPPKPTKNNSMKWAQIQKFFMQSTGKFDVIITVEEPKDGSHGFVVLKKDLQEARLTVVKPHRKTNVRQKQLRKKLERLFLIAALREIITLELPEEGPGKRSSAADPTVCGGGGGGGSA